jgi:hypothetical protein
MTIAAGRSMPLNRVHLHHRGNGGKIRGMCPRGRPSCPNGRMPVARVASPVRCAIGPSATSDVAILQPPPSAQRSGPPCGPGRGSGPACSRRSPQASRCPAMSAWAISATRRAGWFARPATLGRLLGPGAAYARFSARTFRTKPRPRDRCAFFVRETGTDDDRQRRGRWRVAGVAS